MIIKQIDVLFDAIRLSPTLKPEDLASFIHTHYRDYCESVARGIIRKSHPTMHNPLLVAEAAAEKVIGRETDMALAGALSYKGSARYSTYLTAALRYQIPRMDKKMTLNIDPPKTFFRNVVKINGKDEVEESSQGSAGGDTVLAQVYRSALYEGLDDCIAKLEPHEAKLVTMVYFQGLTPTEACRRLGLRSPSYTWRLIQVKLKALYDRNELPSLFAAYRELCE